MRKRIGESEHKSRVRTFVPAAVWALLGAATEAQGGISVGALRERLLTKGVSQTMATRAIKQLTSLRLAKRADEKCEDGSVEFIYLTALGEELKYSIRGVM